MELVWVYLAVTLSLFSPSEAKNENGQQWMDEAQATLNAALNRKLNTNVAKNVILFLGDGMGVSTVTAGRIYKGQTENQEGEETVLAFEKFPHVALSKTYNTDRQTADSAGTATAFLCGVKANYGTLGIDQTVARRDCQRQESGKVTSILDWARAEGKSAGIVTTARITHATPAAGYAHSADRDWEGDGDVREEGVEGQCKDIALQILDNDFQVMMGGGRRSFLLNNVTDPETKTVGSKHRADGRDIIQEWKKARTDKGQTAEYVWNKAQFDAANVDSTDNLLGLFEPSHMQYELDRNATMEPSIAEMTEKAIKILQKNDKGFVLLVESGRIDHGHHDNKAKKALHDLVAMDKAVETAVSLTSEDDTLIVVTADHSHVFNIGGYAVKGKDILGFADFWKSDHTPTDGMPRTTIVYGNGPGYGSDGRVNLTGVDTTGKDYLFASAVPQDSESHGGEDVAIYAHGPMSHLFHGVQEQNYIPHVMAYASCVGINKKHCEEVSDQNGVAVPSFDTFLTFCVIILGKFVVQKVN